MPCEICSIVLYIIAEKWETNAFPSNEIFSRTGIGGSKVKAMEAKINIAPGRRYEFNRSAIY